MTSKRPHRAGGEQFRNFPSAGVERVHTPFVIAPDYKVTDFDDSLGQLAGAYVGRIIDDVLFTGGAGYWLVNGVRRFGCWRRTTSSCSSRS
ncbi:MAG: hypothetical protein HYY76_19590 [Acidobacteria bacterium]|nr:hypothetical protein [Acidobacteriota bacterium]